MDDLQATYRWWLEQYQHAKRDGDEHGMQLCADECGMLAQEMAERERDAAERSIGAARPDMECAELPF